jgi:hypothetical protein
MSLKYARLDLAALVALLFLSCTKSVLLPNLTQAQRDLVQSRRFNASDSVLLSSVTMALDDLDYRIEFSDAATGSIRSELRVNRASMEQDNFGGEPAGLYVTGIRFLCRQRISASIKDSVVKLDISLEQTLCAAKGPYGPYGGINGWEPVEMTVARVSPFYDSVFAAIGRRLRGKR